MALEIIKAGALTSVQDLGRQGYAAGGYQESGACDKFSMSVGNILVGNVIEEIESAVLEFTMVGSTILFTSDEIIALTGADMQPTMNGKSMGMNEPIAVKDGDKLELHMAVKGLRGYLAVFGGIEVPIVMESRSTNLKCGIGGFCGRAIKDGDILKSGAKNVKKYVEMKEQDPWLFLPSNPYRIMGDKKTVLLRVVAGPQEDAFTQNGLDTFSRSFYKLTSDCNRMACKLQGSEIETKQGSDIVSDGIVEGSIQVSTNGQPIVMMADHQTTGGYAKIGTVISTDIPALAQCKPGDEIAFRFVTVEEAITIARKERKKLNYLEEQISGR